MGTRAHSTRQPRKHVIKSRTVTKDVDYCTLKPVHRRNEKLYNFYSPKISQPVKPLATAGARQAPLIVPRQGSAQKWKQGKLYPFSYVAPLMPNLTFCLLVSSPKLFRDSHLVGLTESNYIESSRFRVTKAQICMKAHFQNLPAFNKQTLLVC